MQTPASPQPPITISTLHYICCLVVIQFKLRIKLRNMFSALQCFSAFSQKLKLYPSTATHSEYYNEMKLQIAVCVDASPYKMYVFLAWLIVSWFIEIRSFWNRHIYRRQREFYKIEVIIFNSIVMNQAVGQVTKCTIISYLQSNTIPTSFESPLVSCHLTLSLATTNHCHWRFYLVALCQLAMTIGKNSFGFFPC